MTDNIDKITAALMLKGEEIVKLRKSLAEFSELLVKFKTLSGKEQLECYLQLRGYLKGFYSEIFYEAAETCAPEDLKYFYRASTFKWHPGYGKTEFLGKAEGTEALIDLARTIRNESDGNDPYRVLRLCRHEDMPEVYDLYKPGEVTLKFRLLAVKRCAPHRILDLYRKIYPTTRILNLIALERCPAQSLEELYGMISPKNADVWEVMRRRCSADQLGRLGLSPEAGSKGVNGLFVSCPSPMEIPKAFKKIANPSREESAYALRQCDPALIPDIYRHITAPDEELTLSAVRHCLSSKIHLLAEKIANPSARIIHALIDESDDSSLLELLKLIPHEQEYVRHAFEQCFPATVSKIIAALHNPLPDLLGTALEICDPSGIVDVIQCCPDLSEERMTTAVDRCSDYMLTELCGHIPRTMPKVIERYRQRLEAYRGSLDKGERILDAHEKELLKTIARVEEKKREKDKKRETSPFPGEVAADGYEAENEITSTNYHLKDTRRELEEIRKMLAAIEEALHGL